MPAPTIETQLGSYRIEVLLGRGGMGVVYRAEDLRLGRKVALKLLASHITADEHFRTRFRMLAILAAAVHGVGGEVLVVRNLSPAMLPSSRSATRG